MIVLYYLCLHMLGQNRAEWKRKKFMWRNLRYSKIGGDETLIAIVDNI